MSSVSPSENAFAMSLSEFKFFDQDDRWRLDDVSIVAAPEGAPTFVLCLATFAALCGVHCYKGRMRGGSVL